MNKVKFAEDPTKVTVQAILDKILCNEEMPPREALKPNEHSIRAIISSVKANVSEVVGYEPIPCTDMDFHANMVVLDKYSFIFESTGKTCNVRPLFEDIGIAEDVPIVEGAIAYDDPDIVKTYIILVRNPLYVLSIDSN